MGSKLQHGLDKASRSSETEHNSIQFRVNWQMRANKFKKYSVKHYKQLTKWKLKIFIFKKD
jgi:hypothetical protein